MEYARALKLAGPAPMKVPKLRQIERDLLETVGDDVLDGPALARKSGYPNDSNLRTRLTAMVDRDLLEKVPGGYRRGPLSGHCQV